MPQVSISFSLSNLNPQLGFAAESVIVAHVAARVPHAQIIEK